MSQKAKLWNTLWSAVGEYEDALVECRRDGDRRTLSSDKIGKVRDAVEAIVEDHLAEQAKVNPLMVGAMQFDGSAESASRIGQWVRLADDPMDDPYFSWVTSAGDSTPKDVYLVTQDDSVEVQKGDWIIRVDYQDYQVVRKGLQVY